MKIDRVAMTGADDSITPEQLLETNAAYFEVEWAILLSKHSVGSRRFPSFKWIERLKDLTREVPIKLAGHLCGTWVRELVKGRPSVFTERPGLMNIFQRIQLNFHEEPMELDPEFFKILKGSAKQIIFQMDNVN